MMEHGPYTLKREEPVKCICASVELSVVYSLKMTRLPSAATAFDDIDRRGFDLAVMQIEQRFLLLGI